MATPFITGTGVILRESASAVFTNSISGDQSIFSAVVPPNALTLNRPFTFNCDLSINIPALSLPAISFKATFGSGSLTFVTSAGLVAGVTNGYININGYIVRRADGSVFAKFSVSPSGNSSPLNLTTSNTTQVGVWGGIDLTTAQNFGLSVAFGGLFTSNVTLTRQMYTRSEF